LRFGVGLPIKAAGNLNFLLKYAKKAEKIGFDLIVSPDHIFLENEALTILTAIAMMTKRIGLGTFVLDANRRDPASLAHATATLDRLSNGRLFLGIGKGVWNESCYSSPVHRPVARMLEIIRLLKLFWSGREVTYYGKFFSFEKVSNLKAQPLQRPHPPIWIAAFGKKMQRIAVEEGNGMITQNMPPWLLKRTVGELRTAMLKKGIDPTKYDVVYGCMPVAVSCRREYARKLVDKYARNFLLRHAGRLANEFGYDKIWIRPEDVPEEAVEECFIFGTPREIAKRVEEYMDAGVTYFVFQQVLPPNLSSLLSLASNIL